MFVFDQTRDGAGSGHNARQAPTAVNIQRDQFTRSHGYRASARDHHTCVLHLGREQGDIASQCCSDVAFVDDLASSAVALKHVLARHEVVVSDAVCGGSDGTYIHRRAGCEVNAIGVGQHYLAVGCHAAKNLAGVGIAHAVERDGLCIGLHKVHTGCAANVEGVPVDHRTLAGLVDRHGRCLCSGGLLNGGCTTHHATACGQLVDGRGRLRICTTCERKA